MVTKAKRKRAAKSTPPPASPFHVRFEVPIDLSGARRKFIHRVENYIFENFLEPGTDRQIRWRVANALGYRYHSFNHLEFYVGSDFYKCLHVLEVCYDTVAGDRQMRLDALIRMVLAESELDLGISWQPPIFVRTGAQLLDSQLVNEPLRWLSEPQYVAVRKPFEKALQHFLASTRKPELLQDVITDLYESVEALSKIATGRDNKDLSANAELFINSIGASAEYKEILKNYIRYANKFRHAVTKSARPSVSTSEVESFIYLTGTFLRLALTRSGAKTQA
jgi:hypothetical protein